MSKGQPGKAGGRGRGAGGGYAAMLEMPDALFTGSNFFIIIKHGGFSSLFFQIRAVMF